MSFSLSQTRLRLRRQILFIALFVLCAHAPKGEAAPAASSKGSAAQKKSPGKKAPPPAVKSAPAKPSGEPKDLFGVLPPIANNEGVVFGEPVSTGAPPSEADFGAACSRWLQFHVGGQGRLGQTPLWSSIEEAQRSMHRADARFTPADIKALEQRLGVTRVVLATMSVSRADSSAYQIEYTTYALPSPKASAPKAIGVPLQLKGSAAEILGQLPKVAQTLSQQLGVKSPSLPQSIELSAQEWPILGRGGWVSGQKLSADERRLLAELAPKEPLAALLAYEYETTKNQFPDDELKTRLVDLIIDKAPGNTLVQAELARIDTIQLLPHAKLLRTNCDLNYQNYSSYVVTSYWLRHWGDDKGACWAARNAIYCAPRNPDAWLLYASAVSRAASNLRQGRFASDLNESEWKLLNPAYEEAEKATRRAVELDPSSERGWSALASAATFNSDSTVADGAFWKAYKLNPHDTELLSWGLQMYQPKWGGDPAKLEKVIALASQPSEIGVLGMNAANVLRNLGRSDEGASLERKTIARLREQLAAHPEDVESESQLAWMLRSEHSESLAFYQDIVRQRPRSYYARLLLGISFFPWDLKASAASYREAVRLAPRNLSLRRELGGILISTQEYADAEVQLDLFLKDYPNDWRGNWNLGWVYYLEGKSEQALSYYNKTLQLNPRIHESKFYSYLCDLQLRAGQVDQALVSGRQAVIDDPYDGWSHAFLGWALFKKGQLDEALKSCQKAIGFEPRNSAAHQCLGDIYAAQGKLELARPEWLRVVNYANQLVGNQNGDRRGDQRSAYYAQMASEQLKKYPSPQAP